MVWKDLAGFCRIWPSDGKIQNDETPYCTWPGLPEQSPRYLRAVHTCWWLRDGLIKGT